MILLVRGLVRVDPFDDAREGILKSVALYDQRRDIVDALRKLQDRFDVGRASDGVPDGLT